MYDMDDNTAHGVRISANDQFAVMAFNNFERLKEEQTDFECYRNQFEIISNQWNHKISRAIDYEQSSYSAMLNIWEPVPHPESVPSIPESNFTKASSISGITSNHSRNSGISQL